ncbi:MAG TPA: hypothetical protein VFV33_22720 [Gemmatimonadaceae bacterium]|nr:hypothetical protein [Gemmatimonadaceae bacterium]
MLATIPTTSPWLAVPAGALAYALVLAAVGGVRVSGARGVELMV